MKKYLIKTIPYDDVDFRFISNHWDIHLEGSCIYNNELCQFNTIYPDWNEEKDTWEETFTEIYKLDWRGKLNWICRQWIFEKCVGYHWSYKEKKRGKDFHYRKPQWLYKRIFSWYYSVNKFLKTNK